MRKANIFLHELFTFQFSEGGAIVVPAGQGSIQQTGLTSFFFFWFSLFVFFFSFWFVFTRDDFCFEMFYKVFYGTVECTLL